MGTDQRTSAVPRILNELLSCSPLQVAGCDIAFMNLLCATGLPGSVELDAGRCLATLERWTDAVRRYVQDALRQYHFQAEQYHHHKGFFQFVSMVTLLKHPRGLGIGYEPKAIGNYDFSDSSHDFLHGLLMRRLGTCVSLPVLFVAVGRRLNWPVYLALAKGHVLCQWVEPDGKRVNLEGSNRAGGELLPDEYYHNWPRPLTTADLGSGHYLRPLDRAEELALFLETRGHCFADNRRYDEAREAYSHAHRFAPMWSQYEGHLYALNLRENMATKRSMAKPHAVMQAETPWQPAIGAQLPNRGVFQTIVSIPGLTE